jgi:uncharacterized protein YheU (UPF0270 family)
MARLEISQSEKIRKEMEENTSGEIVLKWDAHSEHVVVLSRKVGKSPVIIGTGYRKG